MAVLIPAYGRKYKTKQEVVEAFLSGKDFEGDISMGFRLCSCRDLVNMNIELRYGKMNEKCTAIQYTGEEYEE